MASFRLKRGNFVINSVVFVILTAIVRSCCDGYDDMRLAGCSIGYEYRLRQDEIYFASVFTLYGTCLW